MTLHVVVAGAGIVGACCALKLIQEGYRVTLLEPADPGGPQGASFGNGAWISPASIIPMSSPGLWKRAPLYLLDRKGPLTIRWRNLPSLAPWLVRFMLAGRTIEKVEATAGALAQLLHDCPARHRQLAEDAGRPDLLRFNGLIYAFADRAALDAEGLSSRIRRQNGVRLRELDLAMMAALAPSLDARYQFGLLVEDGAHCLNPGAYVAAIVARAVELGAVRRKSGLRDILFDGRALQGVATTDGTVACDRLVLAAGIHSRELARVAGDTVPLASERGLLVGGSSIVLESPSFKCATDCGGHATGGQLLLGQIVIRAALEPIDGEALATATGHDDDGQVET